MIIKNNQLLNTASKIVLNNKIRRQKQYKLNKYCKMVERFKNKIVFKYDIIELSVLSRQRRTKRQSDKNIQIKIKIKMQTEINLTNRQIKHFVILRK